MPAYDAVFSTPPAPVATCYMLNTFEELRRVLAYEEETYPPASKATVSDAEETLGFRLPDILRRFYTEVSNGCSGPPGGGIVGLKGGRSMYGDWLPEMYKNFLEFNEESWWFNGSTYPSWPSKLVPFCSWADMKYSCFCRNDENNPDDISVSTADMNGYLEKPPGSYETLVISKYVQTLEEWFELWVIDMDMDRHKFEAYRSNVSRIRYNQNEKWSRVPEKH